MSLLKNKKITPKRKPSFWRGWKEFWAFAGPLLALTTFWFNFTPSISISADKIIDKGRQYGSEIYIANTGRVTIYAISFACGFGVGGGQSTINGNLTPPDLRPASSLSAGQIVARSCDTAITITGNSRLAFEVSYGWPIPGWRWTKRAIFDVRKGADGYFLVPDVL